MIFWQRSQIYTPPLCRLMAKWEGKAVTNEQLAGLSQKSHPLSALLIHAISQEKTWANVSMADMQSYLFACQMDFCNPAQMHRADEYLRRNPTFRYLRADPLWEEYYKPLLKRWRASFGITPNESLWPPVKQLLIRLTPILK